MRMSEDTKKASADKSDGNIAQKIARLSLEMGSRGWSSELVGRTQLCLRKGSAALFVTGPESDYELGDYQIIGNIDAQDDRFSETVSLLIPCDTSLEKLIEIVDGIAAGLVIPASDGDKAADDTCAMASDPGYDTDSGFIAGIRSEYEGDFEQPRAAVVEEAEEDDFGLLNESLENTALLESLSSQLLELKARALESFFNEASDLIKKQSKKITKQRAADLAKLATKNAFSK